MVIKLKLPENKGSTIFTVSPVDKINYNSSSPVQEWVNNRASKCTINGVTFQ